MEEKEKYCYDCIVVGAGISGLGCVHSLVTDHGILPGNVLLLEANDYAGGRVHPATDIFDNATIELGAEILHGETTSTMKIAKKLGMKTANFFCTSQGDGGPDDEPVNGGVGMYCVKSNGVVRWFNYNSTEEEFKDAHDLIHGIVDVEPSHRNQSILKYLKKNGVSNDMIMLLESGYANTCCSSLKDLALSKMAKWNEFWAAGAHDDDHDSFILPPFSYKTMIDYLIEESGREINQNFFLSSPVETIEIIDYEDFVKVTTKDGRVFNAKSCVLSASPGVLKANIINFAPPLPAYKVKALESVLFNPAMKIFAQFTEPFWPETLHGMVCGGFEVPEVWFRKLNESCYTVTGLVSADFARRVSNSTDEELINMLLNHLKELRTCWPFDIDTASGAFDINAKFVKGFVQRWDEKNAPYVRGGYHSPKWSKSFDIDYSEKLARPIDDKIFFCGEATNVNEGSTVPSALDTGVRAAEEVAASLANK